MCFWSRAQPAIPMAEALTYPGQTCFNTRHIWFQMSLGQVKSCGQSNGSWTGTLSTFQTRHQDTWELPTKQFRQLWTWLIDTLFSISVNICERKEKVLWDYPKAEMLSKPPADATSHLKGIVFSSFCKGHNWTHRGVLFLLCTHLSN